MEGLGTFYIFFKHDKRRVRAQEQSSVRSVVLDVLMGSIMVEWGQCGTLSLATDRDFVILSFSLLFFYPTKPLVLLKNMVRGLGHVFYLTSLIDHSY